MSEPVPAPQDRRGLTSDELLEYFHQRWGPPTPEQLERWHRLEPARRIGLRLRDRRRALGLTQQQLSQRAGMRQSQIAGIELGTVNSTIETLDRVCRALGYPGWSLDLDEAS